MNRVGEFEKVSFLQFYDAVRNEFHDEEHDESAIKKIWESIELPTRATSGAAGYDFKSPFNFVLRPLGTIKIPTGIRVKIDQGWWLGIFPRSSLGFKYRLQLDNTVAVIDADYYYSDNEGHIFVKLTNNSLDRKTIQVNAGSNFVQGIFIPYGITCTDNVTAIRNGGIGSTDSTK